MPRKNDRQIILYKLKKTIVTKLALRMFEDEDIYEDLVVHVPEILIYLAVSRSRYISPRTSVPKAPNRVFWLLNYLDNSRFKQELRMDRSSFFAIHGLIKDHPIFQSKSLTKPMTDTRVQMIVALCALGTDGNGGSVGRIARLNNVSGNVCFYFEAKGKPKYLLCSSCFTFSEGSVINFTKRFIVAVLSLEQEVVFWPEEEERREIMTRIEENTGFPSCIGFVDGSLIPLENKPVLNGEDYYTRKGNYCISAMIICDDRKLIRHCYTGWCGSAHDARVFANSAPFRRTNDFFSGEQYLLAVSAYSPSSSIVPTYKKPVNAQLDADSTRFNYLHANLRVRIEHCIGILKGRFPCLRGIRTMVGENTTVEKVSLWIRCCCVLHNLLLKRGDELPEKFIVNEEPQNNPTQVGLSTVDNTTSLEAGKNKREQLKQIVLINNPQ